MPECPNCDAELVWTGWANWWACEPCHDEWILNDAGYLIGPFTMPRPIDTIAVPSGVV